MKYILVLFLFCNLISTIFSQTNFDGNYFHDVYSKYEGRHHIIEKYNKEYFTGDIFEELKIEKDIYPLYFDSYGSLYPDFALFKYLDEKSFKFGSRQINSLSYKLQDFTMFGIFQQKRNYINLQNAIKDLPDKKDVDFYTELLETFSIGASNNITFPKGQESQGGLNIFEEKFYARWDSFHLAKQETFFELASKYQRVIFYAHGYNNSYSFATMQSLEILNKIEARLPKNEKILFVPIFWRARDKKEAKLKNGKYVEKNRQLVRTGLKIFRYHFNSAYLTGMGVRALLDKWEASKKEQPEILLYGHSSGATLITSIFINNVEKLDDNLMGASLVVENCKSDKFSIRFSSDPDQESYTKKKYLKNYFVNYELFHRYTKIPIPSRFNYKVLLSAASLPGVLTFKEMCDNNKPNVAFFNIRNKKDKKLDEFKLGSKDFFGRTTLGMDYDDDAVKTQKLFLKYGYFENSALLDKQTKHNILNYINNPMTLEFFSSCLDYTFPTRN